MKEMSPCSLVIKPEGYSSATTFDDYYILLHTGLSLSHVSCSKLCSCKRPIRNQKVLRSSQRKAKQHWKKYTDVVNVNEKEQDHD